MKKVVILLVIVIGLFLVSCAEGFYIETRSYNPYYYRYSPYYYNYYRPYYYYRPYTYQYRIVSPYKYSTPYRRGSSSNYSRGR